MAVCMLLMLKCTSNNLTVNALAIFFTVITITLEDTNYLVSEDDGFVEIKLVLDQPSCVPISIIVQPRIHMFGDPNNIASGK